MRSCAGLVAALAIVGGTASCTSGPDTDAATELHRLALSSDELVYEARYSFGFSGPLAPAVRYTLTVAQEPPADLRSVETVTPAAEGEGTLEITSWRATQDGEHYACAEYAEGVRCKKNVLPVDAFGLRIPDDMISLARTLDAFERVERSGSERIAGERGRCFQAFGGPEPGPQTPQPSPAPRFEPEGYTYDYCYASDGILLLARRTISGEIPEDIEREQRREAVLEALAVSRSVDPSDLRLPGPVLEEEGT